MRLSHATLALTLLMGIPLAACGGDAETTTAVRGTTTGQSLIDLRRAYEQGLITQTEYEERRSDILARSE
ncbi:SHOCT domain-containing protein [Lacibacterium aquatile]|uniref:SHOCT domain-containing protein n=1 Tax=Lacibacterium aquatile TaxID=1168082 RepID=A0ABW5DNG5_9PROT